ncbi:barstar family protein [Clostridium sp. DL1XJH146]
MEEIILDCTMMTSIEATHQYIKEKLSFPNYYGCNLDALWDILSTISNPLKITITNPKSIQINLGDYSEKLITVFIEASNENENILLDME